MVWQRMALPYFHKSSPRAHPSLRKCWPQCDRYRRQHGCLYSRRPPNFPRYIAPNFLQYLCERANKPTNITEDNHENKSNRK